MPIDPKKITLSNLFSDGPSLSVTDAFFCEAAVVCLLLLRDAQKPPARAPFCVVVIKPRFFKGRRRRQRVML